MSTPPAPPSSPRGAAGRARRISTGTLLVALGFVVETTGVANVPAATADGRLTSVGTVLWLVSTALWSTVLLRRRRPVVPLAAGAALAVVGVDYLLLVVAVHHLLKSGPSRRGIAIAAATAAAVALFVVREVLTEWGDDGVLARALESGSASDATALAILVAVIAVATLSTAFGGAVLARSHADRDRQRDRADAEHGRAEALGEEVVRRAEREKLARDIHDALAHRLSVISLQSGALEQAAGSQDPAVVRAAQALRQQAHQSLDDLRGLLGELRSEPLSSAERAQTPPALASMRQIGHLIRSVRETGAAVDALVLIEDAEHAGAALDRTTYRIVQECLTNALKHAAGVPVSVYVEASASTGVRVRVTNPLPPHRAAAAPGAGRGLVGIRERVEQLSGTAWIGEAQGSFVVDVSMPWPPADGGRPPTA